MGYYDKFDKIYIPYLRHTPIDMLVDDIDLPADYLKIIKNWGIETLYPPQAEALPHVESGKNVLMAVPTAAGKSLVAYVAALRGVLRGGKALYIVPLRALAWEKIEDLREFRKVGLKIGASLGDFDSSYQSLANCDIVVATAEKADSILRHRASWLGDIKVVIGDEVHLIQDAKRGPVMEVILTRFRSLRQDIQIIALSATIPNSGEIALWLDAVHIKSEWRPVKLDTYVFHSSSLYSTGSSLKVSRKRPDFDCSGKEEDAILRDSLGMDAQCLVFVNTRKRATSLAKRMSGVTARALGKDEIEELKKRAKALMDTEREITDTSKELSSFIEKGAAYHHAGLTDSMRRKVEAGFKDGYIKMIAATPTLAAGVNLPARRVIVRDVFRFDGARGMIPISVLEVKQMCGRAGRPGYDPMGEAFIIASTKDRADELVKRYLMGEGETIQSKLGAEGALRMHLLSSIAAGFIVDPDSLWRFIDSTLYAFQSDRFFLREQVAITIGFLLEHGFLKYLDGSGRLRTEGLNLGYSENGPPPSAGASPGAKDTPDFTTAFSTLSETVPHAEDIRFYPTDFGLQTSRLYIDPSSALNLRNALNSMEGKAAEEISVLGILHALCSCPDMYPLYLRRAENAIYSELYFEKENGFLISPPSDPYEFEFFLSEIKTASMILDWMKEETEDTITKKYGIGPGDIRSRIEIGEWLLYSMKELSRLFSSRHIDLLEGIMRRMKGGVKAELLDLISIRDVGRVRARALFDAGFRDRACLKGAAVKDLIGIRGIGTVLAQRILEEAR